MKQTEAHATPDTPRDGTIFSRGFSALMAIQFLGAMNDNVLRGAITLGVATGGIWAASSIGTYGGTAVVGLCLTVPFLIFSGWGGGVADRYSKRTLTIILKSVELVCAVVAFLGFMIGNPAICLAALVLLATQSAFFGPVKYGAMPELVTHRSLAQANGWINMSTQVAIVFGTQVAGPIVWCYAPNGAEYRDVWLPGAVVILIAVVGIFASFFLTPLKAINPSAPIPLNPFAPYVDSIKHMAKGPVLRIAFAWGGFWLVGMIALLAIPDLQNALALPGESVSPMRAATLLSALGVASGIGSVICGRLSRNGIKPIHVPFGAAGMTVFFVLLGVLPVAFWTMLICAAGAGLFAGFYLVPLMTLVQSRAPAGERGRYLGTTNAISFAFMTLAALIYLAWSKVLGFPPEKVFLLCAVLAMIGCVIFWLRRHHLAEWSCEADDAATDLESLS